MENEQKNGNFLTRIIIGVRSGIYNLIVQNKGLAKLGGIFLIFLCYNGFLVTAVAYNVRHELSIAWCDGLGFLLVLTALLYWSLFYYVILKGYCGHWFENNLYKPLARVYNTVFAKWYVGVILTTVIIGAVIAFVVIDCWDEPRRLVSAGGVVVIVFVGTIVSSHPGSIIWRQVFSGLGLQFLFGLAVLRWEGGKNFLECLSSKVYHYLK